MECLVVITVATSGALTLATVNSDTSAVGSTTVIPVITANAKGLVTSIGTASISTVLTVGADSGSNDTVTVGTDTLDFLWWIKHYNNSFKQ